MKGDDVGLREELVEAGGGDAECRDRRGIEDGVVSEDAGSETLESGDDFATDASESDDADGEVAEFVHGFDTGGESPVPVADVECVGDDLSCESEDEGEGVVGDFIGAESGDVADGDMFGAGGIEIDVIDADAVPDDGAGFGHGGDDVGIDGCELGDDDIGVTDEGNEIGGGFFFLDGDNFAAGGGEDGAFDVEIGEGVIGDSDFHEVPRSSKTVIRVRRRARALAAGTWGTASRSSMWEEWGRGSEVALI